VLRGLSVPDAVAHAVAFMPLPKAKDIEGPIFSRLKPVTAPAKKSRARAKPSL
jgi:hypothetical protein